MIGIDWQNASTRSIRDDLAAMKKMFEEQSGLRLFQAFMTADQAIAAYRAGVLSPTDQTLTIFVDDPAKVAKFLETFTGPE